VRAIASVNLIWKEGESVPAWPAVLFENNHPEIALPLVSERSIHPPLEILKHQSTGRSLNDGGSGEAGPEN